MKKYFNVFLTIVIVISAICSFTIIANASTYDANLEAHQKVDEIIQNYGEPEYYLNDSAPLTDEQKNEFKTVVDNVIKDCTTDYEKMYAVTRFVSESIYYDYDYYEGRSDEGFIDPYDVWVNKRTVCDGYARLMKSFLILIDIPCMYISADNHAYNIAYDSQNEKWIYIDATWCSENTYKFGVFSEGEFNSSRFDMSLETLSQLSYHEIYGVSLLHNGVVYKIDIPNSPTEWSDVSKWELLAYVVSVTNGTVDLVNNINGIPLISVSGFGAAAVQNKLVNIEIPDGVKHIPDEAFFNCTNLKTVVLPDSVTSIGDAAFFNCTSLESISMPAAIKSLGDEVFYNCNSLTNISLPNNITSIGSETFYYCTSLEKIVIPDTVTSIGDSAFFGCWSLTNVKMPATMTSLGCSAFAGCTKLEEILIPNGIENIESYTFTNCNNLKSISIPESVEKISATAFGNCNSISSVNIMNIEKWCEIDFEEIFSNPLYFGGQLFLNGELVTDVAVPDGLLEIKPFVFYNCNSLESVRIPDSVNKIGEFAFYNCVLLENINVPDNVTTIGESAFQNCSLLKSVRIPKKTKEISNSAFKNCTSLEDLVIELGVEKISCNAFSGCSSLKEIILPDSVTELGDHAFSDCYSITKVVTGDGVTSLTPFELNYNGANLITVDIGNNIKNIPDYTFAFSNELESVIIGNSVENIGTQAFFKCILLKNLIIPDSVKTIGHKAFSACSSLEEIRVGKGVEVISDGAFSECGSLKKFYISDLEKWCNNSFESVPFSYPVEVYLNDIIVKDLVIPLTLTEVKPNLFANWSKLESVFISDNIKSIGDSAFFSCQSLNEVVIPDSVTAIGANAFGHCMNLSNVKLGKGLAKIEDNCFDSCHSLLSLVIPEGVESIERYAFSYCTGLKTVVLPESLKNIGEAAFSNCFELEIVTMPKAVTFIDISSFENCSLNTIIGYTGSVAEAYAIENNIKFVDINHKHDGVGVVTTEPTCTTSGVKTFTCSCGSTYTETIPATGAHNQNIKIAGKAATCTATGITEGAKCSGCGIITVEQKEIAKLAHNQNTKIAGEAATCTATGYTEGASCSGCGTTTKTRQVIPATGHNYSSEWTIDVPANCMETGIKSHHCTKCNSISDITVIPANNTHVSIGTWLIGREATCNSEGYKYKTCAICSNEAERTVIPKKEHKLNSVNQRTATCTEDGYTGDTYCSNCQTIIARGTAVAKTAHKAVTLNAVAPTCTKTGLTQGSKCSVCNTVLVAQQVVGKKAHTEVAIQGRNATCTTNGLTQGAKCSVCGTLTKAQQTIAATGHKTAVVNAKAPTLKENGYTGDTQCTACKTVTARGQAIAKLVLNAPVISEAKITTNGVKVTWNAVPYAAQYKVYRKTYNASTKKWSGNKRIATITGTEYVDGSVQLGAKYKYLIKAVNGNVTKNSKSTSTITFKISPTPKAYVKSNGLKVKWSTVVSATEYRVYRSEYNASTKKWSSFKKVKTVNGSTKSWTDKKVTSGTKYKYCIKAVNGKVVCSKKTSNSLYFLTKTKVTAVKTTNGITVNWTGVKGASKYRVYRSELQNGAWTSFKEIATPNGKTTSYTDTTAVAGMQYKYKVKAVKGSTGHTSSETAIVIR